ncbi:MAG: sigma-70 family RNA polymerase sigma factor [Saprospiraceae bacterium]|nr:sigma-70 family RNA polymerase sigma factor [Saprospiraceae bacterium]
MSKDDLQDILKGCRKGNKLSQKQLYRQFYRYGMNVCTRYARSDEEAEEILNDAFLRVFTKIDLYDPSQSFVAWFHTICVRSAINYLKKYSLQPATDDLIILQDRGCESDVFARLSADYIVQLVQKLAVSYRTVFNLAVIEGYSHTEIAAMLGITEGTSRSNLMIARQKMQMMVLQSNKVKNE